jgi:ATP-binding cassette subfamily F protein 3
MARLAATQANVLVLDEPTNHLDLWALEALEKSLRDFDGTVLLVSHDRYFINQVADHLIVVEPGRFRVIEGNYATYQHLVNRGLAGGGAAGKTPTEAASNANEPKVSSADDASSGRRTRRFPYRKVADLEQEIFAEETRLEELHAALADPDTHRNGQRVRQVKTEIAAAQQALKVLYEHWEEAVELNW